MWLSTLFNLVYRTRSRPSIHRARRGAPRRGLAPCPLAFETLEERLALASLSVGDAVLVEGNVGTHYATVIVSLAAPSNKTVTVNYNTADGAAKAGSDYQVATGKLTFAAGETSKSILVPVKGDRLGEADEKFVVKLQGARYANIADGQGVVTIVDDEPRLRISGAAAMEGNSGTTFLTFTVSLLAAYDQAVTVSYATADGSATTADNDYVPTSGTLTFAPGETTKNITVEVIGDTNIEPGETFFVNLSGASTNAFVESAQGIGYLVDDDMSALPPPPEDDCNWGPYGCQLDQQTMNEERPVGSLPPIGSISDVTKAEGRRGQTTLFTFTVTLSGAYDQPVTMSYRTANGTATTGNDDYIAKTGTLTFVPGQTSKTITIEVKGDSKREGNETFYLDLFGNSSNSQITKNRGLGTILNDD